VTEASQWLSGVSVDSIFGQADIDHGSSRSRNSSDERALERLVIASSHAAPISSLTHNLYRYPARFSETFAQEAILGFSKLGEIVLDPFVGGGTTAVEAIANGRRVIGSDISELAVFVSAAKCTVLSERQKAAFLAWLEQGVTSFDVSRRPRNEALAGMLMPGVPWQLRRAVTHFRNRLSLIRREDLLRFASCVVLRAAQWALDNRRTIPTTDQFIERLVKVGFIARQQNETLRARLCEFNTSPSNIHRVRLIVPGAADNLYRRKRIRNFGSPRLVLTSPPYPGVHVLYHRWQLRGRKETALPFWLTRTSDGSGAAHYTFVDRRAKNKDRYFAGITRSFRSVADLLETNVPLVQLVAFADIGQQFPLYLRAIADAGFDPCEAFSRHYGAQHWRTVPSRKWYAYLNDEVSSSSREVLLVHRKKG